MMSVRTDGRTLNDSTHDLVCRAQGRDAEAFAALVARFQDAVHGTAWALLGDADDAEDVAQETFVVAWRELSSLREPAAFPGWICRIARNRAHNVATRGRRWASLDGDVPQQDPVDPERVSLADALRTAFAGLSEPLRLVTTLHYVDGYSIAEIAALLMVPEGTVKRRLHDARRALRSHVAEMVSTALHPQRPSSSPRFAQLTAIMRASADGDARAVSALLHDDATLADARDHRGWTPLHHAARHGHLPVAETLLARGADPDAADDADNWTPLLLALHHRHDDLATRLRAAGATLGLTTATSAGATTRVAEIIDRLGLETGWETRGSPLHHAAYFGHAGIVAFLLERGADVNARSRNQFRNTALHCAALNGHVDTARVLLAAGADVHAVDGEGGSPLHNVVKYPHSPRLNDTALIDLLLAHGARVDLANELGETPLLWAATRGEARLAQPLLVRGARLDACCAAGLGMLDVLAELDAGERARPGVSTLTPLHTAAWGGSAEAVRFLLHSGVDINARGGWFGGTPLHVAAWYGRREMVHLLLALGADVNARAGQGWTALHLFRFPWWTPAGADQRRIARLLLVRGGEADAANGAGETPLHRAAIAGDADVARALIEYGARIDARDIEDRTPLQRAVLGNQHVVGALLAGYGAQHEGVG